MITVPLVYLTRLLSTATTKNGGLVAWAPREDLCWVLQSSPSSAALYRFDGKTVAVHAAGLAALGLDEVSMLALFTGADGVLRLYGTKDDKSAVWRLDGKRFAKEVDGIEVSEADTFCGDARTGRFFHLRSNGAVFELRAKAMREIGSLGKTWYRPPLAIWDRARQAIVAILEARGETFVLANGKVSVIDDVPGPLDLILDLWQHLGWHLRLLQDPGSGRAMLLRTNRKPWVLGAKKWEQRRAAPTPAADCFVTRAKDVVAFAVGSPPREWGIFDGKTWSLQGAILPEGRPVAMREGMVMDFLEHVARLQPNGEIVDPQGVEGRVAVPGAPSLVPLELPQKLRQPAWVWHEGMAAVLAIGGMKPDQSATNTTCVFKDGKWSELKTKRLPFKQYSGGAAYDPARGAVVLVGGFSKKFEMQTAELVGTTWTKFKGKLPWEDTSSCKAVAFDAPSSQLFAILEHDPPANPDKPASYGLALARYVGQGVWQKAGLLVFESPSPGSYFVAFRFKATFDAASRRVIAAGPVDDGSGTAGVLAADIGALLDSWPKHGGVNLKTKQAPPFLPRRPLMLREDGSNKYWIAELSGKSWTVRWGKRGTQGQTKTYSFESAEAAKKNFSKKVEEKLDKGYVDAPPGEDPSRLAGRKAWDMKLGKRKGAGDRVHGPPPIATKKIPICRSCKRPMQHLATWFYDRERLPLEHYAALSVFQCETPRCKAWDPDKGANAALLVVRKDIVDSTHRDTQGVTYRKARFEADPTREEVEDESPGGCKVGGYPTWVQDGETPQCDECKKPMVFVAQLDSDDTGMNFGDAGIGYVFCCPDEHMAKFLSQSS